MGLALLYFLGSLGDVCLPLRVHSSVFSVFWVKVDNRISIPFRYCESTMNGRLEAGFVTAAYIIGLPKSVPICEFTVLSVRKKVLP